MRDLGADHDVPVALIGRDPIGDIAQAQQSRQLSTILALLNAGMPVSARRAAAVYGVQFRSKTLRLWETWGDDLPDDKGRSARATYAYLVRRRRVA